MKKIKSFIVLLICISLSLNIKTVYGTKDLELNLYAQAAVLIDGESGKVLYEKNGNEIKAMASTTKIMTCIIALEYGELDSVVDVSKYAASMPDVQLNIKSGQKFILKDLLYSLMLESHNDVAVAIAENVAGDVEAFCDLMNKKAVELGCKDTYFITPNGLDGTKECDGKIKSHSTTAKELALIMKYCIKNQTFLEITQTKTFTFKDKSIDEKGEIRDGKNSYTVNNKNALLTSMEGIISGKTGFTGEAGYCYVCAYEDKGRVYIVTLLGCGWPNNKNYKWIDTKELLKYGRDNFTTKEFFVSDIKLKDIKVKNGIDGRYTDFGLNGFNEGEDTYLKLYMDTEIVKCLCRDSEMIEPIVELPDKLHAPIKKGEVVGSVKYILQEGVEREFNIYAGENIDKKDFIWSFGVVFTRFILQ